MAFNKKTWKSVGIQTGAASALALVVAVAEGLDLKAAAWENMGYLCDGFFVSAVLFGGVGVLIWISSTGFFDFFSYAFKSLLNMFASQKTVDAFPGYYDYKCEKDAKRAEQPSTMSTLIAGVIVLLLSVLCLAFYYVLMPAGVTL